MVKFLLCCAPVTHAGMFKAVAFADLLLNSLLVAAAVYSMTREFHLNALIYLALTCLYLLLVAVSLRKFYEKRTPHSKTQKLYAVVRAGSLGYCLFASYDAYYRGFMLLDLYDGPHKKDCIVFFSVFSACLLLYLLLAAHWSVQLLRVTFGSRSGDDDEDSEEFLD